MIVLDIVLKTNSERVDSKKYVFLNNQNNTVLRKKIIKKKKKS
jgi:hypothetical protein